MASSGRWLLQATLETYKGCHVKAAKMRAPGYARGYIMRVGPKYVDARDITGRLALDYAMRTAGNGWKVRLRRGLELTE